MSEYISRDMAKEALYKTAEEYDKYDKCDRIAIIALNNVDEILNDIPAADVAPVRHGRWEWDRRREAYCCSSCKLHNADRTAFCPNCGARCDL